MTRKFIIVALAAVAAIAADARQSAPISQDDFINAAESTVNGVVAIKSYATPHQQPQAGYDPFASDPFFRFFFGQPGGSDGRRYGDNRRRGSRADESRQRQIGLGSGVIISADGYIVTNNHVVDGAERLEVVLNDNRNYAAEVIGSDAVTDLALIKIDAPDDLHVIPMGDSDSLRVGEWVLAVGNPFGFTSTVTAGIVSAKARNISSTVGSTPSGGIEAYIQTDAAVNSGNSGGALVNLEGRLVGINTAIYSNTGTYAGCSFAIPTSIVNKVVNDLRQYGDVQRAFLGIAFRELTPELVAELGLSGVTRGIHVEEVQDRSAALRAGLRVGDVITHINGIEISGTARLQEIMARCSPGDVIEVSYVRDGAPAVAQVTLRNRDGVAAAAVPAPGGPLGATFDTPSPQVLAALELQGGVEVNITGDGAFSDAGIASGFIITTINSVRVSAPDEVDAAYRAARSQVDKVLFISGMYPDGRRAHYAVSLD